MKPTFNIFLLLSIFLIFSCDNENKTDENGFINQDAQGRIDDEIWILKSGFAEYYNFPFSQEDPVILVNLIAREQHTSCENNQPKEYYIHFAIEEYLGLRKLSLDGFNSTYQVGIIGATDRTEATTLLDRGKIDITEISSNRISGKIAGYNTTFKDTYVNGNFTVEFCQ